MNSLRRYSHFAGWLICLGAWPLAARFAATGRVSASSVTAWADSIAVHLPDGSRAMLSSGATIRYQADFNRRRTLWLIGKASLDVRPGPELALWTETAVIKATGAHFKVAAVGREFTRVEVMSGSTLVRALNEDQDPAYVTLLIGSGQRAVARKMVGVQLER